MAITGNPEPLKQTLDVHTRSGVDGTTFGRSGTRGPKFTVQTKVDQDDLPTARDQYDQYVSLIGSVQNMTWRDRDMSAEGFSVVVVDVRCVDCRNVLNSVGGLNGSSSDPSLAILIADWDLIAVPSDSDDDDDY